MAKTLGMQCEISNETHMIEYVKKKKKIGHLKTSTSKGRFCILLDE